MARKTTKPTASGGPAKTRRRRNVRAVTIDLEATEVGEAGANESEPDPAAGAETMSETPVQPDAADTGAAKPGENGPGEDGPGKDEPDGDPVKDFNIPAVAYLKYGATGLAGGVLALLIYTGLARFGLAPVPASGGVAELAGSLDRLRQSVSRQEDDWASRLEGFEIRLSGLAANDRGAGITARLDEFEARITNLGDEITAIDVAAIQRLDDGQDAINSEMAALSDRLAAAISAPGSGPRLAGLEARLGVLETNTETLLADLRAAANGGAGTGIASADLLALRQSLTSLQASANEMRARLTARMDGLDTLVETASAASAALFNRIDEAQSGLGQRVGGLEVMVSDLPDLQFTTAGAGAEARAAASLAFAALERAVREGLPYGAELELLTSIAGSIPDEIVTSLAAGAGNGVPTMADLADRFEALATIIIEADTRVGDDGFLDQTLNRIRSVVRIRPTGFVEGDSVAAIVARAEAYLKAGQLRAAVDELVALEGPAGEAVAGWFGAANTRLDTSAALTAINRYLLGAARPADAGENQ